MNFYSRPVFINMHLARSIGQGATNMNPLTEISFKDRESHGISIERER